MDSLIAGIGHNRPPPDEPTPFDLAKKAVEDIYSETVLWLDGNAIDSQDLADGVGNLLAKIREAEALAEETRKAEKKPLDEKVAEIQARYAPLIADTKAMKGKTVLAAAACKKALEPWLAKVAAEIAAVAQKAREEAAEKARVAQEAIRAADASNLAARAAAEELIKDAKRAERTANKAEKQTATAGGMMGRAIGLRTEYVAIMVNPVIAARHVWKVAEPEIRAFVQQWADGQVRLGKRELPGFEIREEQRAV